MISTLSHKFLKKIYGETFFILSLQRILLRHFIINMRRIIPIVLLLLSFAIYSCTSIKGNQENTGTNIAEKVKTVNNVLPEQLTYAGFLKNVWNFEKNPQQWVYEGNEPSVIDFYAVWCGPCKRLAPIMVEMAKKYDGKVKFYRVDVDKEKELASAFRIRSIPTVLFIPKKGKPFKQVGLLPHSTYVRIIDEQLLHKKPQTKK